jgi:hypothetical protein
MNTATANFVPDRIKAFPQNSPIWIFGFEKDLKPKHLEEIAQLLNQFIDSWHSHGNCVSSTFAVIDTRFLLVIADPQVSGCGKDSLMRAIGDITVKTGATLANSLDIFYRSDSGKICLASRSEFQNLLESGEISEQTSVFNLGINQLSHFLEGGFEKPFSDSVFRFLAAGLRSGGR